MALVLEDFKLEFRGLSDEEDEENTGLGDDAGDRDEEEDLDEETIGGKEDKEDDQGTPVEDEG